MTDGICDDMQIYRFTDTTSLKICKVSLREKIVNYFSMLFVYPLRTYRKGSVFEQMTAKVKYLTLVTVFILLCGYPERYKGVPDQDEVAGLEIYLPTRSIFVNEQLQARALLIHASGEKTFADNSEIAWSTDDSGVISIDTEGLLTALRAGEGTIMAITGDLSATDTVIVAGAIDYSKIVLSEIFYDDTGSDEGKEFIEIYNGNNGECDLSDCMLVDGSGSSIPFVFPENSTVIALGIAIVAKSRDDFLIRFGFSPDYSEFTFTLNNSGETVFLMNPDGVVIDCVYIEGGSSDYPADEEWVSLELPSAEEGYSVQRMSFDDSDTFTDWIAGLPSPGVWWR